MGRFRDYPFVVAAAVALVVLVALQRGAEAQRRPEPGRMDARSESHRGAEVYRSGEPGRGPYGPPPTPTAPPPPPCWEYAVLRFDIVNGGWVWMDREATRAGDKGRIYRELGGGGRPHGGETSYVDIANQAGTLGWELASVLEREKGTEIWFKRMTR